MVAGPCLVETGHVFITAVPFFVWPLMFGDTIGRGREVGGEKEI